MSAIGPGDWVECIELGSGSNRAPGCPPFRIGGLYMVEECGVFGEVPYLVIIGHYSTHSTRGWTARSFRPIYRPKQSIIEQLKQPAPEIVREVEAA